MELHIAVALLGTRGCVANYNRSDAEAKRIIPSSTGNRTPNFQTEASHFNDFG